MIFDGQYLTYAEYQSLGGTLAEVSFNTLELTARSMIDTKTFGRLKNLSTQTNEVKVCMYQLINVINISKNSVSSETIDGYSVHYADTKEQSKMYEDIIFKNLAMCKLEDGTPYLYCGVE